MRLGFSGTVALSTAIFHCLIELNINLFRCDDLWHKLVAASQIETENEADFGLVARLSDGFADDLEELSDTVRRVADHLARSQAGQPCQRDSFDLHSPLIDGAFATLFAETLHLSFERCRAPCDPLVAAQLVLAFRVRDSLDLQTEQVRVDRYDVLCQLVFFDELLCEARVLLSLRPYR